MEIKTGLEFTSTNFSMSAKVSAVREEKNEADVILTPGDGNAWEEKGWNLEHIKLGFERGEYLVRNKESQFEII